MLAFERPLWAGGCKAVAGVDEVGRGPLAGSVVAAAVIFQPDFAETEHLASLSGLTDSKQLTAAAREAFYAILVASRAVSIGVGQVDAAEIDRINILNATHRAMAAAVAALRRKPDHILLDGRPARGLPVDCTAIIGGDARSLSIAAASVIAKVVRDRQMQEAALCYPHYGFEQNKGYGTAAHVQALLEFGPCPIHRRSFRPVHEAEAIHRDAEAAPPSASEQDLFEDRNP